MSLAAWSLLLTLLWMSPSHLPFSLHSSFPFPCDSNFLHPPPLPNQVWLTLFPEGTRFDPTKTSVLTKSKALAKDHGLPVLHHVLTPRTTGFEVGWDVTVLCDGAVWGCWCEDNVWEHAWCWEAVGVWSEAWSNLLLVAGYHIHDGRVSWLTLEVDLARLNK